MPDNHLNGSLRGHFKALDRRLVDLHLSLRKKSLEQAKIDLKKCEAFRANLAGILQTSNPDLSQYFQEFQEIDERLIEIDSEISKIHNTWWRRAWRSTKSLLATILSPATRLLTYRRSSDDNDDA